MASGTRPSCSQRAIAVAIAGWAAVQQRVFTLPFALLEQLRDRQRADAEAVLGLRLGGDPGGDPFAGVVPLFARQAHVPGADLIERQGDPGRASGEAAVPQRPVRHV